MRHAISFTAGVLGFASGLLAIWAVAVLFPASVEIFSHRITVLAALLPALTGHALVELGWAHFEQRRRYARAVSRRVAA